MLVGDSDSSQSDSSGSLADDAPPSYTDLTHPLQQASSERTEGGLGDETPQRDTELVQISFADHPTTVIVNPTAPPLPVEGHRVAPYGQGAEMGIILPVPQQAETADQILPAGQALPPGQAVPLQGGVLHPVFYQPTSGKLFMSVDGSYHALPWQFGVDGVEGQTSPGPTAPVT